MIVRPSGIQTSMLSEDSVRNDKPEVVNTTKQGRCRNSYVRQIIGTHSLSNPATESCIASASTDKRSVFKSTKPGRALNI